MMTQDEVDDARELLEREFSSRELNVRKAEQRIRVLRSLIRSTLIDAGRPETAAFVAALINEFDGSLHEPLCATD